MYSNISFIQIHSNASGVVCCRKISVKTSEEYRTFQVLIELPTFVYIYKFELRGNIKVRTVIPVAIFNK